MILKNTENRVMSMEEITNAESNAISDMEFTPVSIDSFFDKTEVKEDTSDRGIVVITPHQQELIKKMLDRLHQYAPEKIEHLEERLRKVKNLAKVIATFPSLLERTATNTSIRTPEALIESLVSYQEEGDTTLHLPSKATLGKGLLISKMHTFYSMYKLAKNYVHMDEKEAEEYLNETVSMMFTLMAEDVYLNLIRDKSVPLETRMELANSLIILWEHRSDQTMEDIAPVLQSVWTARRKLAPAFGTMMGTSELLLVSIQMDEQWNMFIKKRLGDREVSQAMEEFLFGISYEQITRLRNILKEQGVKAIGRDEVSAYLGERVKTDIN